MIRSMTGFGRASFRVGDVGFEVEVRAVNHRHLDARVRLPKPFASLEPDVRARIQARLARGKVDCAVSSPDGASPGQRVEVDLAAARQYLAAARALRDGESVGGELEVAELLALPGVARFAEPSLAGDEVRQELLAAVDTALAGVAAMREQEGRALESDLRERLARVEALSRSIEARSDTVREAVRERLRKRSEQLAQETGLLDEARLHQEIVLAADRLDITEELVRLRSHVEQFRSILSGAGPGNPVGRQLDFLMQELGREANTVGSKGGDAPIAHDVVELKTELERVREQVQNVE